MNEMVKILQDMNTADEIFKQLNIAVSMPEIAEIIDSLDENMAKLVLKKFVYARGQ
ncbi:hypothetical protein [Bacteroides sp.]|uniref:hypothetical protein n=1 Tax=Bacteroides sp. TaxID=29523 RepID=UPI0026275203|nr:hypothetical protein [Bacteroides sp.]MDD3040430.1 hypothetical protein [Bacteroides sp.]